MKAAAGGSSNMKYTYKSTLHACYTGYFTQAIVNNLAPLFFVIFQNRYGLSFEEVGRLILINFVVQIAADIIALKFMDSFGYRKAAVLAHFLCALGLVLLAVLPNVFSTPYVGIMTAVVFYACGGGLLEVLVSPIVNALPGDRKDSAMSLLHSFYCWGQVSVVLVTTLLLGILGHDYWPLIPLMWALIPIYNLFRFLKVPLAPALPDDVRMPLRKLFQSKFFVIALLMMLCAGASELTMSQWSSLFAEKGLHLPKVLGDLLGPCLFAVFMGIGRTIYGFLGNKINLKKALFLSSALCVLCYLTTVFAPWPLLSLMGCAFCGLSVSLMWPGTFSLSAERFPGGGTAMFGMLAVSGDIGCSLGPWLTGFISDMAKQHKLPVLTQLIAAPGMNPDEIGLKTGLFTALLFPVVMTLAVVIFRKKKQQNAKSS